MIEIQLKKDNSKLCFPTFVDDYEFTQLDTYNEVEILGINDNPIFAGNIENFQVSEEYFCIPDCTSFFDLMVRIIRQCGDDIKNNLKLVQYFDPNSFDLLTSTAKQLDFSFFCMVESEDIYCLNLLPEQEVFLMILLSSGLYGFCILTPAIKNEILQNNLKLGTSLPPDADLNVIHNYLSDSRFFEISNSSHALEIFDQVHSVVVSHLIRLNELDNCTVPQEFMKLYYKFRHNIFSILCKFCILNCSLILDTDDSLSKYLPESDKTPDWILEDENSIKLIEFTVGNKYQTIDYHKGGGNYEIKYTYECKKISEILLKRTQVFIIPAVLDNYNIVEIYDILSNIASLKNDPKIHLERFFDISNFHKNVIARNQLYSLSQETIKPVSFPNLTLYERPKENKTIMVSADFLSRLTHSFEFLKKTALRNVFRKNARIKLFYDIPSNRFFTTIQRKGESIETFLENIDARSITYVMSILNLEENGRKVPLKTLKGTIPVTIQEAEQKTTFISIPTVLRDDFYTSNGKLFEPERDVSLQLNIKELPKIGVNSQVAFPPDYFEKLCNLDTDALLQSKSKKILANCNLGPKEYIEAINTFDQTMSDINRKIDNVYPKQTFQTPFVSDVLKNTERSNYNQYMIQNYLEKGSGLYTKEICSKLHRLDFAKPKHNLHDLDADIVVVREELSILNSDYYTKLWKQFSVRKYNQLNFNEKRQLQNEKNLIKAKQKQYSELLRNSKIGTDKNLIKIPCSKTAVSYNHFQSEMAHFKKTGSQYRGVGELSEDNYLGFNKYIKLLISRLSLKDFNKENFRTLYNRNRLPGPEFLNKLKNNHTERWDEFYIKFVSNTLLEQLCEFNSRLSSLLFNESVKSYNKDFIKIDNIGFDNIIVFVRGGSKIYKNQTSKLFRVMFYIDPMDLKYTGYKENPSFEVIHCKNGKTMIISPWSQIRQDSLFDLNNISPRTFLNLYSTYTRMYTDFDNEIDRLSYMPFLLALHNRRKTEKFMHNSRYLIVNPLGLHANIKGIIESFADFNYTYLDAWLRARLSKSYVDFASKLSLVKSMKRVKINQLILDSNLTDLWLDEPVLNADHLTVFIYITYMMTKAPVNSSLEQASNLWEILEDVDYFHKNHSNVKGMDDTSLRFNILEFDEGIYDDDFKYDPAFCQYLGHHLSGYLKTSTGGIEIANHWNMLKDQDIDRIANSNGLRGWNKDNFFNKKGYEVVYEKVDEILGSEEVETRILNYLESTPQTAFQAMQDDKLKPKDTLDDHLDELLFHVVHKIQRGGGREIFCMDLNTKIQQNPIEKLFKFICKRLPNEFISIPSNKRHSIIHSDFYEKGPSGWTKKIFRWVLDCRRWAPHSVFQKYVHFIHGLSPILPSGFINEFNNFALKMFNKKFVTRDHVLNKMRNNEKFKKYEHLVHKMERFADGFCFTVQFSFVMGIFNYLSTLMHAANQIVASEVVRNLCLKEDLGLVILDAKCHSDDSVVSSYHEKEESSRLTFVVYDWLLKGANHMLSVKKSQINENVYLEFLSILYLFDRFLPVIPKFSSNIPFKPSDRGYASDITFSITQCIEMLSQGGSFDECFLILKLTERYIQNVYNIPFNPNQPYNFLGCIDSHPLELLYAGGNADLARSLKYNPIETWKNINYLKSIGLIDFETADLSLKWDMNAKISNHLNKKIVKYGSVIDKLSEIVPWTLSNNKLGNSTLNMIWYLNKLKDRHFYSSLVDEPVARRFSRIFGAGGYRTIINNQGVRLSVKNMLVSLRELPTLEIDQSQNEKYSNYIDFVCRDLYNFYDSLEGTELISSQSHNLTDKPITFKQGSSMLGNTNINAVEYTTYVKEPLGYKLLGRRENPFRDVDKITTHLKMLGMNIDDYDSDQLYSLARKVLREDSREYRIVAPVTGDNRRIENYSDVLKLIECNTFKMTKLILRNKSAQRMDWDRKIVHGHVPQSVINYISLYWTCHVLEDSNLTNLDIFLKNPWDHLISIRNSISEDWKPIVNSAINSEGTELCNTTFWSYWSREQIKIGNNWFGSGNCILSLPECILNVRLTNGIVDKIELESNHTGSLSSASSWYLNTFFRFSGVNAEMVDSNLSDPTKIYLSYNSKDAVFGIGRAKGYDLYFPQSEMSFELLPSFCFKLLPRYRKNKMFIYEDQDQNLLYKINFFITTDEPVTVDFFDFLDSSKVKKLTESNMDVRKFVEKMSLKEIGSVSVDKSALIDNIGRSLIYHVCYTHPDSVNYFRGDKEGGEPFIETLIAWKKTNPSFGFPSEEDLSEFLKQRNMPLLPIKIYEYLIKIGKSQINDEDYKNIIFKMLRLKEEERFNYLSSAFPLMDNNSKLNTLTISMKSDRIYDSCKWLGNSSLKLTVPLILLITEAIEEGNVFSATLQHYRVQFNDMYSKIYKGSELFKILAIRVLMNTIMLVNIPSNKDPICCKFYQILKELLEGGLSTWLNLATVNDPLLSTVEFQVENSRILNWIVDIFDCSYRESNMPYIRAKKKNSISLYGPNGPYNISFGQLRNTAIKMKQWSEIKQLNLVNKVKLKRKNIERPFYLKKTVLEHFKSSPGVTIVDFKPLVEDSQELFDDEYYDDMDITFECEFDNERKLPKFGYTDCQKLNLITLTGVRGGAWNMFIKCQIIYRDIWQAKGFKKIYRYSKYSKDPNDFFINQNTYLFYIGTENFKGEIEDFEEISRESAIRIGTQGDYGEDFMIIEGQKYPKDKVFKTPILVNKIETVDSYFSYMSVKQLDEQIKQIDKQKDFVDDHFELKGEYLESKIELENLIKQAKEKIQTDKKSESDIQEQTEEGNNIDFFEILKNAFNGYVSSLGDQIKMSSNALTLDIKNEAHLYSFKKPLEALTDIRFRAEFETLFPGMWEPFINNELCITKKSKKNRLYLAKMKIDRMPEIGRNKFRKIYLIVCMLLNSIRETSRMDPKSMELGYIIDDLFYFEDEEDIEGVNVPVDLMPTEMIVLPYDIKFIT